MRPRKARAQKVARSQNRELAALERIEELQVAHWSISLSRALAHAELARHFTPPQVLSTWLGSPSHAAETVPSCARSLATMLHELDHDRVALLRVDAVVQQWLHADQRARAHAIRDSVRSRAPRVRS